MSLSITGPARSPVAILARSSVAAYRTFTSGSPSRGVSLSITAPARSPVAILARACPAANRTLSSGSPSRGVSLSITAPARSPVAILARACVAAYRTLASGSPSRGVSLSIRAPARAPGGILPRASAAADRTFQSGSPSRGVSLSITGPARSAGRNAARPEKLWSVISIFVVVAAGSATAASKPRTIQSGGGRLASNCAQAGTQNNRETSKAALRITDLERSCTSTISNRGSPVRAVARQAPQAPRRGAATVVIGGRGGTIGQGQRSEIPGT